MPSSKSIIQLTAEHFFLTNPPIPKHIKMLVYVKWKPPDRGTITLNTDRAFHATTHKAGFGGVFRNHKGEWIMGYAGHYQASNVIDIELMALLRGLQLAIHHNLTSLVIQMDAQKVISMLHTHYTILTLVN